ncbi:UNVERIFIED_ORG: hypothetical protein ABIB13_001418 [Arthrobacter sp. UYEF2]
MDDMLKASPEEQATWWAGLSEEDRKYLIEGEDENGPFADDLMRMDGGIPQSAQDQASDHLRELAKTETPVYTESGKASLDAVEYSPENAAVIDSYMRNVALGDTVAAGQDAAKLYEAGSATVQANHMVTASNEFGIDLKAGEVEVKTENKATTNVSTY